MFAEYGGMKGPEGVHVPMDCDFGKVTQKGWLCQVLRHQNYQKLKAFDGTCGMELLGHNLNIDYL